MISLNTAASRLSAINLTATKLPSKVVADVQNDAVAYFSAKTGQVPLPSEPTPPTSLLNLFV